MKNLLPICLLTFIISACSSDSKPENADSLRTDSALKAQLKKDTVIVVQNSDTTQKDSLPAVMEGDLVFQISEDEQSMAYGKACKSKYNNIGMIFIRPKDHTYMVLEVKDSIHAIPLTEWVERGQGKHFALLRLRMANQTFNEKKTTMLKMYAKTLRGKGYDIYYSWSDEAFYSAEMIWKLYKNGANVEICKKATLASMDLTGALVKQQMKNKYGDKIPLEEEAVTPNDIFTSPKLEIIYER